MQNVSGLLTDHTLLIVILRKQVYGKRCHHHARTGGLTYAVADRLQGLQSRTLGYGQCDCRVEYRFLRNQFTDLVCICDGDYVNGPLGEFQAESPGIALAGVGI